MERERCKENRLFLKDHARDVVDWERTDQAMDVPMPPVEVALQGDEIRIPLMTRAEFEPLLGSLDLTHALETRRSSRRFDGKAVTLAELSYLLWATAGYREPVRKRLRHAPSAGNRQPIETYVVVFACAEVPSGVYRYHALRHELILVSDDTHQLRERSAQAARDQDFAGNGALNIIFSAIPYRTEWRYDYTAHRVILIDVGHLCQNLYLAVAALDLGCCAIAAYDQKLSDQLIQADGEEEFVVYMCPVGHRVV